MFRIVLDNIIIKVGVRLISAQRSIFTDTDPVNTLALSLLALGLCTVIYPNIAEALYSLTGGLNATQIVFIITALPFSFISILATLGLYNPLMPRAKVPCLNNQFL